MSNLANTVVRRNRNPKFGLAKRRSAVSPIWVKTAVVEIYCPEKGSLVFVRWKAPLEIVNEHRLKGYAWSLYRDNMEDWTL
jgi:hypothetical protein